MESARTTSTRRDILDERAMRIIALGLLLITALVAWHQVWGSDPDTGNLGPVLEERSIVLRYHPESGTVVSETSGAVIEEFASGEGGILEMLAVVIGRDRMRFAGAPAAPITLRLREGGQLSVFDAETGREINMASYGQDNIAFLRGVVFEE
ncbi:MAG: photosynthetic complex assembly protein PuhC [Pseudomonadota bacterium]